MNKKSFLLLIASGLTGTVLGYWGGQQKEATLSPRVDVAQTAAPASVQKEADNELRISQEDWENGSLDDFFLKCSRMSPPEREQILKWLVFDGKSLRKDDWENAVIRDYFLSKAGEESPQHTLNLLSQQNDREAKDAKITVIRSWADKNPEAAYAYFQEHKKELPEAKLIHAHLINSLAKHSPEMAWAKWGSMDKSEKEKALPLLLTTISDYFPKKMEEYMSKLTLEDLKSGSIDGGVVEQWATQDWEKAKKWIDNLPDCPAKTNALYSTLNSLAGQDIEKAKEYYETFSDSYKKALAPALVNNLATISPTQALHWLQNNELIEDKERYVWNISRTRNVTDAEFRQQIDSLPQGKLRDTFIDSIMWISRLAWDSQYVDPEQNIKWASTIENEEMRANSMGYALETWLRINPKEPQKWIESSTLPAHKKEEYRQLLAELEPTL